MNVYVVCRNDDHLVNIYNTLSKAKKHIRHVHGQKFKFLRKTLGRWISDIQYLDDLCIRKKVLY